MNRSSELERTAILADAQEDKPDFLPLTLYAGKVAHLTRALSCPQRPPGGGGGQVLIEMDCADARAEAERFAPLYGGAEHNPQLGSKPL